MTYEAMIELLSKAKGVNLETFDWKGNKSLADLHREIEERDVTLHIHEQTGEAIRVALSVKVLISTFDGYELREYKRKFRNGKCLAELKNWSISETRKRGERVKQAAARGLLEELDLHVTEEDIDLMNYAAPDNIIPPHPSSVYPGIISQVIEHRVGVMFPKRPWIEPRQPIKDHGIKVYTRWFKMPL